MELTEPFFPDIVRVMLAMLAGGLVGLEREFRDKSAGFRTLIFISAGSSLFTILSRNLAPDTDPNRIAANIVTGIGFLGAGAILRDGMRVTGLTTAATIWLTAAIGMSFGAGSFLFGAAATGLTLIVLWLFPAFEHAVDKVREEHTYEVAVTGNREQALDLESQIQKLGLRVSVRQYFKEEDGIRCRWVAFGKPGSHEKFVQHLLESPQVRHFNY
jgi:putative Mg2+ transporter-C (MgtC) family protein